jgi:hypothetical protein
MFMGPVHQKQKIRPVGRPTAHKISKIGPRVGLDPAHGPPFFVGRGSVYFQPTNIDLAYLKKMSLCEKFYNAFKIARYINSTKWADFGQHKIKSAK